MTTHVKNPDVHYVVFDGISYFVSPETELQPDWNIVERFTDINEAFDLVEELENEHNGTEEEMYYM